jgi:Uncharacterized protein conserved in bacteria (DUF2188)
MAKLPRFTLTHNDKKDRWQLEKDKSDKVVKTFENKADALAGGILKKIVGAEGGSVKIQKIGGKFQEERTYPRSRDPKKFKG